MLDSHHHLWTYQSDEYPWIPPKSPLAQNYLLPELTAACNLASVTGTIAVQARQSIAESEFLLEIAHQSTLIRGVVGWVPLVSPSVQDDLERLASQPKFVGVRHVLQDEDDRFFRRPDFNRGLSLLPHFNLSYDLLIYQHQIPAAQALVDQHPKVRFIINHLAKPQAQNGPVNPDWQRMMSTLAQRENIVGIKFSGLATEFPPSESPTPDTLQAYFHETLNLFGIQRLMFGTDWPVALLRLDSYQSWAQTFASLISSFSPHEKSLLSEKNAEKSYQLKSLTGHSGLSPLPSAERFDEPKK